MPRIRELENSLLGIVKAEKQERIAAPVVSVVYHLSAALFSGICLLSHCAYVRTILTLMKESPHYTLSS